MKKYMEFANEKNYMKISSQGDEKKYPKLAQKTPSTCCVYNE